MKRKLLISGVTLGACVLTVSVIMSGAPSVVVSPTPAADPPVVEMAASAPLKSDLQTSTDTDQIIVAFTATPANLRSAAKTLVGRIAAAQVGANVVSVNPITARSAAVNLDVTLSRSQANRIAKAVEASPRVDYAEASVNFYPNSDSSLRWNLEQIKLDHVETSDNAALKPIVVGVIDTGVADNADLPKALLVNSLDGVIWGKSVSGTAWPTATVHLSYTDTSDTEQHVTVKPDPDGSWTYDPLEKPAQDGTGLIAYLVDASGNRGDDVTLTVDAVVSLTVVSPINTYTVRGTTDAGAKVVITQNGGSVCETTATSEGSFECLLTDTPSDGSYTVTATDPVGNESTPAEVVIDTANPGPPTINPSRGDIITGTAEPGATVTLTYPGGTEQTTADSNGDWSITFAVALNHGDTVTAVATDAASNTSEESETRTIDHEAPSAPMIDPNPGDGHSIVVTNVAAGDTPSLRSTTTDPVPAGAWSHSDGTWTFTPDDRLSEDPHLEVILTDEAGNESAASVVEVDTTAPELTVVTPSTGETLSGTAEAGATITLTYPDTATQQITADSNGDWSVEPTATLHDGDTVTVVATDAVGNSCDPLTITIDQLPPTLTVVSPSTGGTITGTAEADARITLTYPDESTQQITADSNGDWSVEPTASLSDGDTVVVTATDAAGNTSAESVVSIDRRAPELSVATTDGTTVSGTSEVDAAITIAYTDADHATHTVHTTVGEGGTWTVTLDPVAADRSTVAVTAADALGNESDPISRTVHYGPPSAPVVDASDGHTVVVRGIASGDVPSLVDSAGDPLTLEGTDNGDGSWTFTPADRLAESDELYAIATDDAGVRSELSARIVIDTTAPIIEAADVVATTESLTGPANTDLSSLTISYTDADSHDQTATATIEATGWSATLDPAAQAGSQATLTAADAVGNESTVTVDFPAETASPSPSPTPSEEPVTPASESTSTPSPSATVTPDSDSESEQPVSVNESSQTGTVLPGYDFYSGDDDATDDAGQVNEYHGTHVAGTIASEPNSGYNTQGVATGVKILPIKVFGLSSTGTKGAASLGTIAEAIRWGAGLDTASAGRKNPYPARILNLSLGAFTNDNKCPATLQTAINAATANGTLVVTSAGNDTGPLVQKAPANCENVLVVTATTSTRGRASYSNWGTSSTRSSWLVAAPGGSGSGDCTYSSASSGWVMSTGSEGYVCMAGTSQAAPHVTGVAARMLAVDSTLQPEELATMIRGTSTPLADDCPTGTCGSGIVNAVEAIAAASRFDPNSGSTDPVVVPPVTFPQVTARFSGTLRTGYTQTASASDTYTSATLSYQWYRNGQKIEGARSRTYTATPSDYGTRLSLTVTDNFGYHASASATATVAPGYISSVAKPKILGTRKVGKRLRATKGSWSVPTTVYRYKWYRNGKTIKGATSRKYKLTSRDRGKRITVRVYVKSTGYYNKNRLSGKTARIR